MHDYQLERLNTRSFEQLVQAIGLEIIGPQLMIFGDGPDGGREATFDSTSKYPATKKKWNGFGIVQAKFRQQPDSEAKKNADWAIQCMKEEFAKLKPRPKRKKSGSFNERVCPEYYIFATNLALSPVAQRGGKDRVRTLFDGFKKSHGLKDYAIWDGDQIRRFLDGLPGIRTTYTAWLLPGDVLAEMVKVLQLEKTDFLSTIRRFLESELLDDQFARLGQGGYTDAKNIPLCAVFVDLPVDLSGDARMSREAIPSCPQSREAVEESDDDRDSDRRTPDTFLRLLFEEGRQILKPSAMNRQVPRQGAGRAQAGHVVLVGGPGQGKTTVGQFACQLLRAALLRATGGPFSPEVSQALERIEQMSQGLPVVYARRYPLRVDLKHLAACLAATGEEGVKGLFDYLVKRIASRTNSSLRSDDFRRWLGAYPWVLVLDGLDEVPASSNRQQVMQAIRDFVSVEAHGANADLLVLATTRPQGYSEEFDPSLYHHLSLAPLSSDYALDYGLRLARARHPGQPTRIEELTASLRRATTNPATVRLMQSPLQVTIMLALIEGGGEPPEQRWKLFHDYYDVIYRREKERGTSFSAILGRYEPDIHWIHRRAGWLLQQRNAGAGQTDARLTHDEFEQIVDKRLQSSGHDDTAKRSDLVKVIRSAATDRLVLLVGNTEKAIGFEIRSLQEFMAAEHFFDGGEVCVQKTLHVVAPDPYWRNVFLFASGRIFFERQELIDSVVAVCGEMNDDPNDPAQRTILSGSRLALALLKDGAARNQPASIRVIARCAARGFDACDSENVHAFCEAFSGEAEEVWKEELVRRLSTSCPNSLCHNWLICLRLIAMGKSWANELLLRFFPWKSAVAQQIFYQCSDLGDVPIVFWDEYVRNAFNQPPSLLSQLRLSRSMDKLPKTLVNGFIGQFLPLFDFGSQQEWKLVFGDKPTGLAFRIHGRESLTHWAGFEYPADVPHGCHPEWHVFQAISVFARNPAKASLGKLLIAISQITPDAKACESRWCYPWQVAECVASRMDGNSWHEIISSVENGCMGTEKDWTRWDEQNRKEIRLSHFCGQNSLSSSDGSQGPVLKNAGWSFSADVIQVCLFANALSDALVQWPELRNQQRLVDLCCFGLCEHGLGSTVTGQQAIARFLTTCLAQKVTITTPALAAVILGSFSVADKRSLLAKAGDCSIKRGWLAEWEKRSTEANRIVAASLQELLMSDECWNVLRALSFLPPLDALQNIPELILQQLRSKGDGYSKAAACLKINSLQWKDCDAAKVAEDELALKKDYPDHLNTLFDFIETTGKSGSHLEAFLFELITKECADLTTKVRERATGLIVKLVERRPAISTLPDPAVRLRATLP